MTDFVNKQVTCIPAKAVLGRFPIMADIMKHSFRYWQSVVFSEISSVTHKALDANIDMDRADHMLYYVRIKSFLAFLQAKPMIYLMENKTIKINLWYYNY